jgi:hypothetical protein
MTFGDRGMPVPMYGANNRQGPENSCDHRAESYPDSQHPAPETSGQVRDREVDRGNKETARTSALAPIPADSELERFARSSLGQPEKGISFTKVSRGDWIRTSDLLNPIQAR